jgi:eukaryotic-like serine/threonine-protein kinase
VWRFDVAAPATPVFGHLTSHFLTKSLISLGFVKGNEVLLPRLVARFVYLYRRTIVRLGPYETLVDLGRGGMADLYVARADGPLRTIGGCEIPTTNPDDPPLVILKTLRAPLSKQRIEMFNDEARLALLFDHPNVVQSFGAGEDAGRFYIALEYLDGQPVDRVVHRLNAQPDPRRKNEARTILLYVLGRSLGGLHYAHELTRDGISLQIVHRDFNPQNLFVTYDGRVKALDFGIAKAQGRVFRTTTTGEIKGKIRYMAPEQALSLRIDRRADVFAAGVMLWEFCSGTPFWPPDLGDRDVFEELVGGNYQTGLASESPAMNAILRRALARDASERYPTADEMRLDLMNEIARTVPLPQLAPMTSAFVSELFHDQRERTSRMLLHAVNPLPIESAAAARGRTS